MNKLQIAKDSNGIATYAINFAGSGDIRAADLDANQEGTITVPADARIAIFGFSSGLDYWVSDATITIPSANTFSANRVYLNPPPLVVTPGTTLYVKTTVDAKVTVAFYS